MKELFMFTLMKRPQGGSMLTLHVFRKEGNHCSPGPLRILQEVTGLNNRKVDFG